MEKALYWEKERDGVRCLLCPHYCFIPINRVGICKQRKNISNSLYTMNYGVITSYGIDPMEKKPLYHFLPGTKVLSYGSSGCNLRCNFCQNHSISLDENPESIVMKYDSIVETALNKKINSIAFTYNEPTVWYEFMMDTAKLSKTYGLNTVCVTNGFINKEPLLELIKFIDAFNVDLKSFSDEFYRRICGGRLNPVLESIKTIYGKSHLEITTLIVENENDNMEQLEELFKWISEIDKNIVLHLSRYFPAYKSTNPITKIETLLKAKSHAEKYLNHVYIGNVY